MITSYPVTTGVAPIFLRREKSDTYLNCPFLTRDTTCQQIAKQLFVCMTRSQSTPIFKKQQGFSRLGHQNPGIQREPSLGQLLDLPVSELAKAIKRLSTTKFQTCIFSLPPTRMLQIIPYFDNKQMEEALLTMKPEQIRMVGHTIPIGSLCRVISSLTDDQIKAILCSVTCNQLMQLIPHMLNRHMRLLVHHFSDLDTDVAISSFRLAAGVMTPFQVESAIEEMTTDQLLRGLEAWNQQKQLCAITRAITYPQVYALVPRIPANQEGKVLLCKLFNFILPRQSTVAVTVLSEEQRTLFKNDILDETGRGMSAYLLSNAHLAVAISTKQTQSKLSPYIPDLLPCQLQTVVACCPPDAFNNLLRHMNIGQLVEAFTAMNFEQMVETYEETSLPTLRILLPHTPPAALVQIVPHMNTTVLNALLVQMQPEQLWQIVPQMTDNQKSDFLSEFLNITVELLPYYLDQMTHAHLVVGIKHFTMRERLQQILEHLNPAQLWVITPMLFPSQLLRAMDILFRPEQENAIVSNLTLMQKEGLCRNLDDNYPLFEAELKELIEEQKQAIQDLRTALINLVRLERSSEDPEVTIETLRSDVASLQNKIMGTLKPTFTKITTAVEVIAKKINTLKKFPPIYDDTEYTVMTDTILEEISLVRKKNQTVFLRIDKGTQNRPSIAVRLQKLVQKTQIDCHTENLVALTSAEAWNRNTTMSIYEGARAAAESIGGTTERLGELNIDYDDLIAAGIRSVDDLAAHSITTLDELSKYVIERLHQGQLYD